ncbi:MAG TPA: hypothetical protein VKE70_14280, partial [Candidatus Solibacter sp.]|nr:hypothetical protein [Candidatus Solibacter sp.]
DLNKTTTANVTLEVGSVSTALEVTDSAALLDTTTAQVANNYNSRVAADLPTAAVTGGVLNLSLLGAGVSSGGGLGVGTGPSVGGQRPRNNSFNVEGVDNNRKDVTGPIVAIPNDAVEEFSVLQNQFSAEFGHSSGGQFNTVLRSGSNEMHGGVWEYLQNRDLDALDQQFKRQGIFDKQRYDQNRLGGRLGGHLIKNKLFYYGVYEYNPLGQASTPGSQTIVPTAQGYSLLSGISGLSATNLQVLKQFVAPAPQNDQGFATVKGVKIPLGTLPISAPNYTNGYAWLVSIDYNLSSKDQIRGRYVDNKITGFSVNNNAQTNLPIFFGQRPITGKVFSFSEFHTFKPNVTNELRLAYNRYNDSSPIPNFSFPGLDVFPNIQIQNDMSVQIGPFTSGPQATIQDTYQIVDNLSWTHGRHDLKFGIDARKLTFAGTFIQRVRGDYDYTTLERYLLDYVPDLLAQRNVGGKPYSGDDHAIYAYANDNFRVDRHLTLNLGLRYEFNSVPRSMKEFALNSLADVPGVITFFAPQPQKKNFAPRVGFAYSPGESGATSIRGGFGMAYDQIFDNVGLNARPPQATSTVDRPVVDQCCFLGSGGIKPNELGAALTPAAARAATSSWLPNQKLGYALTWNLGVQHVFAKDYTLEVRYVGTKGVHLLYQQQLNRNAVVTPSHFLPTYLTAPSQATLDALPLTLAQLTTEANPQTSSIINPFLPAGFPATITAYVPRGNSIYHGLATELTRRFSRNLTFKGAYTWSHIMDDSTAEVNSTTLSPRRPQDFNNIRSEWASSLLDRRHRFTFSWIYDTPWMRNDKNWFKRNIIGNYQISGVYTVESPEYVTPQSSADANLNGDAAADRVIINTNGTSGTSSDVTALKNTKGDTVAYLANNGNAQFIRAQKGALATSGRNILAGRGINNWDFSVAKAINWRERYKLQVRGDFFNGFNHPQYTPGSVNNVTATNRAGVTNYLTPGNALFGKFDQVYASNARVIQLGAKLTF